MSELPFRTPETPPAPPRPYIGGQAVLEGVMMRSPTSLAIVVRRRDGSLHIRERAADNAKTGLKKLPFVRGVMSLVEAVQLGKEAIGFSAEQFEKDMVAEEAAAAGAAPKSSAPKAASKVTQALMVLTSAMLRAGDDPLGVAPAKKSGGPPMGLTMIIALAVVWGLPQVAAQGIKSVGHYSWEITSPQFQVVTGIFKLAIVISYMMLIRRVHEIRRMFQYHGAEHKTISTYEANLALTLENARPKTTLHPRCGTTFLVMVALMSVVVFSALGQFLPKIDTGHTVLDNLIFFVVKIPFIPVIAGITFEIQRLFARYATKGPLRLLLLPGFAVQKITTIEPDDAQLEVALGSLRVTLFRESGEASGKEDVRFANYTALLGAERLRAGAT